MTGGEWLSRDGGLGTPKEQAHYQHRRDNGHEHQRDNL